MMSEVVLSAQIKAKVLHAVGKLSSHSKFVVYLFILIYSVFLKQLVRIVFYPHPEVFFEVLMIYLF